MRNGIPVFVVVVVITLATLVIRGFFKSSSQSLKTEIVSNQVLLEAYPSWQKLAVSPESWVGKEIDVEGWLYVQLGEAGQIGEIYLFETLEFLRSGVPHRSLKLSREDVYREFGEENFTEKIKALRNKCISLTGIFKFPKSSYHLGEVVGPLTLKSSPYDVVAD